MEANNNNFKLFQFDQIELPKPIENNRFEWVTFGKDNNFPEYITELLQKSALHNAILTSKAETICGKGVTYEGDPNINTDNFINNPNPYESLDEIVRKISWDLELYGGFYLNVIWSRDKKSIPEIYHVNFKDIRTGKLNDKNQITEFYYSPDWYNYRKSENKPIQIPAFNTKDGGSQILMVKPYIPGQKYYPLPSYIGALNYIEIDGEIANFHLAHIRNGMNPSISLTFTNGIPSEEERKLIERQITNKFTSTDNAGKFMLSFVDNKDKAPIINTISPAQLDKQFIQLSEQVLQNILSGHRITSPLLVGIKTEGQLGGASELQNAYSIYQNTVILPHRKLVLDALNKLGKINNTAELSIINNDPIQFTYTESTLLEILTQDEMRTSIGYEPLSPETNPIFKNQKQ